METFPAENSEPKFSKLEIFQTIQKNLSTIGIGPRSSMPMRIFNRKILTAFLSLGLCIFCTLMHIFVEAKSFLDLCQSTYECSAFILVAFVLMALAFNSNELFETINDCERLVNSSKWKQRIETIHSSSQANTLIKRLSLNTLAFRFSTFRAMAAESHGRVEKITAIVFFFFVKISPAFILPPFVYSFFVYFTTDLGPDAFISVLPMWWAFFTLTVRAIVIETAPSS